MTELNSESQDDACTWWGIGILYLMLTPIAVLAYFAFKALRFAWDVCDGTIVAIYAVAFFAISSTLIVTYLIMVARQIYIEFIVPKLAKMVRRTSQQRQDGN